MQLWRVYVITSSHGFKRILASGLLKHEAEAIMLGWREDDYFAEMEPDV